MFIKSAKPHIGVTTLGEKGQVVIPAEIRIALKLKKGEKLLVFAKGEGMLGLTKISNVEPFARFLASHLDSLRSVIKRNKHDK